MSERNVRNIILAAGMAAMLGACQAPPPREPSRGHISEHAAGEPSRIPAPVLRAPFVPPPAPRTVQETYTVVVHEVPVKELAVRACP